MKSTNKSDNIEKTVEFIYVAAKIKADYVWCMFI